MPSAKASRMISSAEPGGSWTRKSAGRTAARVPTVPGAQGLRPVPKPNARNPVGVDRATPRARSVLEMVPAIAPHLYPLSGFVDNFQLVTCNDLTDHGQSLSRFGQLRAQGFELVPVQRDQQLIITATLGLDAMPLLGRRDDIQQCRAG